MSKPQPMKRVSGMKVKSNVKAGWIEFGGYIQKGDIKAGGYVRIGD